MFLVDEIAGREAQKIGPAKTEKLTISVRELLHIRVELELSARQEFVHSVHEQYERDPSKTVEAQLNTASLATLGLFAEPQKAEARKLEPMLQTAETAFLEQRIFILLDDRQAENLDEMVDVKRTATATFLLLTPLKGG